MQLSKEHEELRDSLIKFIDREINPYIEEWETARIFPAHLRTSLERMNIQ